MNVTGMNKLVIAKSTLPESSRRKVVLRQSGTLLSLEPSLDGRDLRQKLSKSDRDQLKTLILVEESQESPYGTGKEIVSFS